jgi:hypothetical protein
VANNTLGKITVKNIGAGASNVFNVRCDTSYDTLLFDGRREAKTSTDVHRVPSLAAGASFSTQGINGAWIVNAMKCTADPGGALSGDRNLANNSYEYRRDALSAAAGKPLTAPVVAGGLNAARSVPDLTFDSAAMTADADRTRWQIGYRVHVKNVGARASSPSEVVCTDTSDFSDAVPPYNRPVERRTWTWMRPIPAIAAGANFSDQVEVLGNESLIRRSCVIDAKSTSGDTNKANNTFTF